MKPDLVSVVTAHMVYFCAFTHSEKNLSGNIYENFKNFEVCFNDYCIQGDCPDLAKDPMTTPVDHSKKP